MKYKFLLIVFFFSTFSLFSQAYQINDYQISVTVSSEGYFDVEENITVFFNEKSRGIFRKIPFKYKVDGKTFRTDITDVDVVNWKFKKSTKGNELEIRIGDKDIYLTGEQHYKLSYRVYDAFIRTDEYTEFYWNLIGTEWDAYMENIRFSIRFPEGANLSRENIKVFAGREGTQDEYIEYQFTQIGIMGKTNMGLFPKEGLTVAAKLPADLIQVVNRKNTRSDNGYVRDRAQDKSYPIPIIFGSILFGYWRLKGRNLSIEGAVEKQYYPPEGISSAEVGTFFDNRANTRDVISLLAEWGRKEYIRIRSLGKEYGQDTEDLLIEKTDILRSGEPAYQKLLFSELFAEEDAVLLSSLKNKFSGKLQKVKSSLKKEVKKFSLYDESSYKVFHSGWFVGLFFAGLAGAIVLFIMGQVYTGFAVLAVAILSLVIHFMPPKHSQDGLELKHYLKGFKKFLDNPSDEKLAELSNEDPKYFEKILPFAIAFGIDKKLIEKFNTLQEYAPSWYYYADSHLHHNNAGFSSFSENFNIKSVSSAFSSSPGGSSGSGSFSSSGGGSVGGGFGGGGGGSW